MHAAEYATDSRVDEDTPHFASVDADATVILPVSASFSELTSKVVYESADEDVIGTLVYSYADRVVGEADIRMNEIGSGSYTFTENINDGEEQDEEVAEGVPADTQEQESKDSHSIHIEVNAKNVGITVAVIAGVVLLILLLYWLGTHSYLIRQKIAGMKSRRIERNRYQTIRDTRRSRRRGKKIKKSKNLRF